MACLMDISTMGYLINLESLGNEKQMFTLTTLIENE